MQSGYTACSRLSIINVTTSFLRVQRPIFKLPCLWLFILPVTSSIKRGGSRLAKSEIRLSTSTFGFTFLLPCTYIPYPYACNLMHYRLARRGTADDMFIPKIRGPTSVYSTESLTGHCEKPTGSIMLLLLCPRSFVSLAACKLSFVSLHWSFFSKCGWIEARVLPKRKLGRGYST